MRDWIKEHFPDWCNVAVVQAIIFTTPFVLGGIVAIFRSPPPTAPITTGSIPAAPKKAISKPPAPKSAYLKCMQGQPSVELLSIKKEIAERNLKNCIDGFMNDPLNTRRYEFFAREHCADRLATANEKATALTACNHLK